MILCPRPEGSAHSPLSQDGSKRQFYGDCGTVAFFCLGSP